MKIKLLICTALISSNYCLGQLASTNGLTASYSFTGNANDDSGNNQNGTVYGATLTTDRFGIANSAYYFDGVSAYIELPYSILLNLNEYSYSYWAKPDVNLHSGSGMGIISVGGATNANPGDNYDQASSFTPNNQFFCGGYNYGTPLQTRVFSGTTYTNNTWHHITVIRSLSQTKMFVDGLLISCSTSGSDCMHTGTTAHYGLATTKRFALGNISYLPSSYAYHGIIDDLLFYNRAIADSEAVGIFNNDFVGLTEKSFFEYSIEIFPNPANDKVKIYSKGESVKTLQLYNIQGNIVDEKNNTNELDLQNVKAGIYFIIVRLNNGTVFRKKLVKE